MYVFHINFSNSCLDFHMKNHAHTFVVLLGDDGDESLGSYSNNGCNVQSKIMATEDDGVSLVEALERIKGLGNPKDGYWSGYGKLKVAEHPSSQSSRGDMRHGILTHHPRVYVAASEKDIGSNKVNNPFLSKFDRKYFILLKLGVSTIISSMTRSCIPSFWKLSSNLPSSILLRFLIARRNMG